MVEPTGFDRIFANTAVERGWIEEERLRSALRTRPDGVPLADHLVAAGALTRAQRESLMAMFETALAIPGYTILSAVGRSATSSVYRGRNDTGEAVAIKVLSPRWSRDPDVAHRFRVESEILRTLRHPNIVAFRAAGEDSGTCYIAMEFIEGPSLARAVARRTLSIEDTLRAIMAVAGAMGHAHERGVIHRDLSPRNILLRADGTPKVIDFGTALLRDARPRGSEGVTTGTPIYMSPEQATGRMDLLDERTDVYSLGAVLYEAITGRPPFSGKGVHEILDRVLRVDPPPVSASPGLQRILGRAMAKDPSARFATMSEFGAALEEEWNRIRAWRSIALDS